VNKGLFIEMWYFECYDEKEDVEFAIMYCINNPGNHWFGKLLGLGKSADTMVCAAFGEKRRSLNDHFFKTFDARDDTLKVSMGDSVFLEAIDDETIKISGDIDDISCKFDLKFTRALPELDAIKTAISKRKADNFWFHANMPRATVTGSLTIDGETRTVDCIGYHDHDWGSPTKVAWSPWSVVTDENFALVTYTSDRKFGHVFLLLDGTWTEMPMPSVTILDHVDCSFAGKRNDIIQYHRPVKMALVAEKDNIRVEYVMEERPNKYFLFDFGWEWKKKVVHAPATVSVNYVTSGKIFKNGAVIKEFSGLNTSFQWYECMDYLDFLK